MKPVFNGVSEAHPDFNFLDLAIERKHRLLAQLFSKCDTQYKTIKPLQQYCAYVHFHTCFRDIAMKIVESKYWEDALRSCHVVEDCSSCINPEVADVSHPAAADQEAPLTNVSHPAAADQEAPLTDVNPPAAAEQGVPPTDVNPPAAAEQGVLSTKDQYHLTKTTPMRELIKEMPGIVDLFALLESLL